MEYAKTIARQWDAVQYTKGFVVSFTISMEFISHYKIQTIAYDEHMEYSVPIEELERLNNNIIGRIELVSVFTTDIYKSTKIYNK